ncbi:MAG: hypothetical protein JRJ77_03905 [Deltaproteobacteria bacterium]|nr:hypothetical protein [Deltaproteobacteria bacterium]
MTDEQVKMLSEAIKELAEAIRELGDRVANDEPLNYSISRGFNKIAEAIKLTK